MSRHVLCLLGVMLLLLPTAGRAEEPWDEREWQLGTPVPASRIRCTTFTGEATRSAVNHCVLATPPLGRTVKLGRFLEGPGLELGHVLLLRGGVNAGLGYDSNVFFESQQAGGTGAGFLNVRGHVSALATGPRGLRARLRAVLGHREQVARRSEVRALGGPELDAELLLGAAPVPGVSLELADQLQRSMVEPLTGQLRRAAVLSNTTAARLRVVVGKLALHLEHRFALRRAQERELSHLDQRVHLAAASLRWIDPLPVIERLTLNLGQQLVRNGDRPVLPGFRIPDARPFRGTVGALFRSAWFYATLELGYGAGFVEGGADYEGAVASVQLGGLLAGWARAWLGFHHDFGESMLSDYLVEDAIFGGSDFGVADGLLVVHQGFAVRYRRPRGAHGLLALMELDHYLGGLWVGLDFLVLSWMHVGLDYDLQLRIAAEDRMAGVALWSYLDHRVSTHVGVVY